MNPILFDHNDLKKTQMTRSADLCDMMHKTYAPLWQASTCRRVVSKLKRNSYRV